MNLEADWNYLGDSIYHRIPIYQYSWSNEFNWKAVKIASSSFGGHIAIFCPATKPAKQSEISSWPLLIIANAAGKFLSQNLYKDSMPIHMFWTSHEELLIVQKIGRVNIYDLFGNFLRCFSISSITKNEEIIDAHIYTLPSNGASGLAVLSDKLYQISFVNYIHSPQVDQQHFRTLPDIIPNKSRQTCSFNRPPTAWVVYARGSSAKAASSGSVQVLCIVGLVSRDRDIYCLENVGGAQSVLNLRINKPYSAITNLAVSFDLKFLAALTNTNALWIGDLAQFSSSSSSSSTSVLILPGLAEVDLQPVDCAEPRPPPRQLVCCPHADVLIVWPHSLQLVTKEAESLDFFYPQSVLLVPEVDGCRILTESSHELLQRVPVALSAVTNIQAEQAAVYLLEAEDELIGQQSGHTHEALQALFRVLSTGAGGGGGSGHIDVFSDAVQAGLKRPIQECLKAAAHVWTISQQKSLLRAARLGRGYLIKDSFGNKMSQICTTLRILNFLRQPEPAPLPLTYDQLNCLGAAQLIDRLLARRQFPLALRISQDLGLPAEIGVDHILACWACQQVARRPDATRKLAGAAAGNNFGDPDTLEEATRLAANVCERVSSLGPGVNRVSFTEIATRALEAGRRKLAEKLIEYEPKVSEQVNMLLRLDDFSKAIARSVDSHDSDLILFTLNALRLKIPTNQGFLSVVSPHTTALALLQTQLLGFNSRPSEEQGLSDGHQFHIFDQEWTELLASWRSCQESPLEIARNSLRAAFQTSEMSERKSLLIKAAQNFKGRDDLMSQECEQHIRLIDLYRDMHVTFSESSVDSAHLNVRRLLAIVLGLNNRALIEQIKHDFKIPDKAFWFLHINILAGKGLWAEMDKLSRSRRKLPVGFEVFVEACLEHGNVEAAEGCAARLDQSKRVRYLLKIGRVNEAIDLAFQLKSDSDLFYLQWNLNKSDRAACERIQVLRQKL